MAELCEADKRALEIVRQHMMDNNSLCATDWGTGGPTTIADCISQLDLDKIVPDPNADLDFCVECRGLREAHEEWEKSRKALAGIEWQPGEIPYGPGLPPYRKLHVCPNEMYRSGLLHDVVKDIVMQILSKISVGP
jgi:hypothetical protein